MITKTVAEIKAMSSTVLRGYAREIGVKRSATDTKTDLLAKVLGRVEEVAAAEKALTEKARETVPALAKRDRTGRTLPPKGPKLCSICNKRPVGSGQGTDPRHAKVMGYCAPCLEEAEWENTHSDEGHEAINAGRDIAPGVEMTGCWICHPELNAASDDYVAPTRRSKVGMEILAKGTYHHKSELVKKAIEKAGGEVIKSTHKGDKTQLLATFNGIEIVAGWTGDAFNYALASWDGKKYRNVKELVRLLGQA